jgi:ABC-type Fe3+ transport system substrate-binding protein
VRLDLSLLERQAGVPISVPAGFEQTRLDAWYGPNVLGAGTLYDPQQHWLGTAISGFGVVYNKDVLATLGVAAPASFEDLCNPRLAGWLVFADPASRVRWPGHRLGAELLRVGEGVEGAARDVRNTRYYTNTAGRPLMSAKA